LPISGRARIDRVMHRRRVILRKHALSYGGVGIEDLVSGKFCPEENLEVFVTRHEYDLDYVHANIRLQELYHVKLDVLEDLFVDPELTSIHPAKALFIDTETTGLSGGTGAYVFLVGIGYLEPDRFVVEQFLMRDPSEEGDIFTLLQERMEHERRGKC